MIPTLLICIGVAVIGFLVIVALQPAKFRVERSTTISAPPSVVFAQVNDFHNWQAWSPWAKLDPEARDSYEGSPAGKGAIFTWSGNKKVGEGRMTIIETTPDELIRIKLEFVRPFAATNTAEFSFKPQGSQTLVNWSMTGEKNFMFKGFCMLMNMDKIVGGDFEKGLVQMKAIAEAAARNEAGAVRLGA